MSEQVSNQFNKYTGLHVHDEVVAAFAGDVQGGEVKAQCLATTARGFIPATVLPYGFALRSCLTIPHDTAPHDTATLIPLNVDCL